MTENEGVVSGEVSESTSSAAIEAPDTGSNDGQVQSLVAEEPKMAESKPEPESYREKIMKKAAENAEKAEKAPKAKQAWDPTLKKMVELAPEPGKTVEKDPKTGLIPPVSGQEKAAYTPNFKFKFTDETQKQQEKEFPDWAKNAIKDPESEKEVRSVFEKAGGLDFVLPRYKQAREELSTVKPRLDQYENNVQEMKTMYAQNDMQGIFDKLGITEEKVLQYAVERAKYYELPPEQQSIIKAQQDAEKKAQFAHQQADSAQQRYEEQARQIKQLQLNTVLQRTDVTSAAKSFDERVGKPGAFFEQVQLHGETTWYRTNGKVDLTPEQAIADVMKAYGLDGAAPAPAATPAAIAAPAPAQAAPAAPAPTVKVIPHIGSGASSPASGKPKPRSLDDLRKISKEMLAQ